MSLSEQYKLWVPVEVRWADMDAMGHVNNAKYFTYLESARVDLFQKLALSSVRPADGFGVTLVSVSCDFLKQVHYPATLEIGTRITKIGNSSFHLEHDLFFEGTEDKAAQAKSVVVWSDYRSGTSVPLPDEIRNRLKTYQA